MTRSPSTASADVAGIPLDAVEFYRALERTNSREWWAANKERYAASVREPMAHLGDVLTEEFGEPTNLVLGANIAGFRKVADAMIDQGVV